MIEAMDVLMMDVLEKHQKWLDCEEGGEWADLRNVDLQGAGLQTANLQSANLKKANLTRANLAEANLQTADLRGACLCKANLKKANLERASLVGANLQDANLRSAYLRGTDIQGADLRLADLMGANLTGADLRGANLDYSCWPLWCGSFDVRVDRRIAAQLAYHFCRLNCDDPEYLAARSALVPFANTFHRSAECGRMDECGHVAPRAPWNDDGGFSAGMS